MKKSGHLGILILAAGITVATAVVHARWTNRWGNPAALSAAAAVIERLPREFGSWRLVEKQELAANARGILQCHDFLQGAYENRETNERVLFTLLLGPPGPMSVHTPEICYTSMDSIPVGERQRITFRPNAPDDSAWMVQFRSPNELKRGLTRIYYTWSDGTKWDAVKEPRITYGARPYLFKAQILVQVPEAAAAEMHDAAHLFFQAFFPEFAKAATTTRGGNLP